MAESSQAKSDGTLEMGEDPMQLSKENIRTEITQALETSSWSTTLSNEDESEKFTIDIEKGEKRYKLEILAYRKISWANRPNKDEKRIQLGDFQRHKTEFNLDKKSNHRCLLLGIYKRNNITIICAWDAYAHLNHGQSSTYVDVKAIAAAMRDGFAQSYHGKGLVCCFQPNYLAYYINNMHELHERVVVSDLFSQSEEETVGEERLPKSFDLDGFARNRIVYGAPGTGKSRQLDDEAKGAGLDLINNGKRVTFYPDYSYAQFIGCYRPVPVYKKFNGSGEIFEADHLTEAVYKHEPLIDYRFVPGPFLELLCKAKKLPGENFILIIEELNRADAPAVFGEAFQMLDRDESGQGVYQVTLSREAIDYLKSEGISDAEYLVLPSNLYIWTTMNSADQGVMPLDAAFKRRWSFEYLPLNEKEDVTSSWGLDLKFLNSTVGWNDFRSIVNDRLRSEGIPEDRHIGPFFMKESELSDAHAFKNKLLLYLCDDVTRHNHRILFHDAGFGQVVSKYDEGSSIFVPDIHNLLSALVPNDDEPLEADSSHIEKNEVASSEDDREESGETL